MEFRKKLKGCGIKYCSALPKKELKERLGFCSTHKPQRKVEISDDDGFSQIFRSMTNAAKECEISNASALKYALDNKKETFTRRSDQKKFYIREIISIFGNQNQMKTQNHYQEVTILSLHLILDQNQILNKLYQ